MALDVLVQDLVIDETTGLQSRVTLLAKQWGRRGSITTFGARLPGPWRNRFGCVSRRQMPTLPELRAPGRYSWLRKGPGLHCALRYRRFR